MTIPRRSVSRLQARALSETEFDAARGMPVRAMHPHSIACHVLPHESADGPAHMALDEALLDAVAGDPRAAVLRTYGWTVPTLSLGYFQGVNEAEGDPRWRGVPLVRRPTGGGAIWHHHELTYALVVPRDHPLSRPSTALYHAVHAALIALLRAHGIAAERRGTSGPVNRGTRPLLCFTDRDPEDIVVHGAKIVGSAQRRRSGAMLQHGSFLLARSPLTPELPGAGDLASIPRDVSFWAACVSAHLPRALGMDPQPRELDLGIRERARSLEHSVYRQSGWTRRR